MKMSFGIKGKNKKGIKSGGTSKMSVSESQNGDIRSPHSTMEGDFARIDESKNETE